MPMAMGESDQLEDATRGAKMDLQAKGIVVTPEMEQVLEQAVLRQSQSIARGAPMEQTALQQQLHFDQTNVRARARLVNAQMASGGSRPDF